MISTSVKTLWLTRTWCWPAGRIAVDGMLGKQYNRHAKQATRRTRISITETLRVVARCTPGGLGLEGGGVGHHVAWGRLVGEVDAHHVLDPGHTLACSNAVAVLRLQCGWGRCADVALRGQRVSLHWLYVTSRQ